MVMLLKRMVMVMLGKMVEEGMMMAGMRLGVMTVARVMAIMRQMVLTMFDDDEEGVTTLTTEMTMMTAGANDHKCAS
jgi:hypothetical protein